MCLARRSIPECSCACGRIQTSRASRTPWTTKILRAGITPMGWERLPCFSQPLHFFHLRRPAGISMGQAVGTARSLDLKTFQGMTCPASDAGEPGRRPSSGFGRGSLPLPSSRGRIRKACEALIDPAILLSKVWVSGPGTFQAPCNSKPSRSIVNTPEGSIPVGGANPREPLGPWESPSWPPGRPAQRGRDVVWPGRSKHSFDP
jgi:hypothetical protein